MARCAQESCPNWAGDGGCPCAVLDLPKPAGPDDRMRGGHLHLDAESLMSKWGFSDGEALNDWWWDQYDEAPPFDDALVLHALVVAYLVPALRAAGHQVEIFTIQTNHNPVRAETLNGVEVDHYSLQDHLDPPVSVTLSPEQVTEIVRKTVPTLSP